MRRNIDADEFVWDVLTTLAEDMGYRSRQDLVRDVLKSFTDQYPDAKFRSIDLNKKRLAAKEIKDSYDKSMERPIWGAQNVRPDEGMRMFEEMEKDLSEGTQRETEETPELPEL